MALPLASVGGSFNGPNTGLPLYDPNNPLDITWPILREVGWSANRPPHILGRLDPPASWYDETIVSYMTDTAGNLVLDASGDPIREFGVPMPRYLSSKLPKLEAWRLEAYFRSSKAFSYRDMWARQPNWVTPPTAKATNAYGNILSRHGRDPFNARCWSLKHSKKPSKAAVKLLEKLTQVQLDHNTTWVVTPAGIHPPKLPNFLIPLDSFTEEGYPHTPSPEVQTALTESRRLMQLARATGKTTWHELESNQLPLRWIPSKHSKLVRPRAVTVEAHKSAVGSKRRPKTRSETSEDAEGDTYELFMSVHNTGLSTKQQPFQNPTSEALYAGQPMLHNTLGAPTAVDRNQVFTEAGFWRPGHHNSYGDTHYWNGPTNAGATMQDQQFSTQHRVLEQDNGDYLPESIGTFGHPGQYPSWNEPVPRHPYFMTNTHNFEVPMQYRDGRGYGTGQALASGEVEIEDQEIYNGFPISYAGPSSANQFGNASYGPVHYESRIYASQSQGNNMSGTPQPLGAEPHNQSYNRLSLSGDTGDNIHEYAGPSTYAVGSHAAGRQNMCRRYGGIGSEGYQTHPSDAISPSRPGGHFYQLFQD
ncbi:hypothetical protein MMC26_006064 [Xylographa opegraphella]|nr:hypothetical protein [Xylographa opegraphella]